MLCAYCKKESRPSKEHIISSCILDLFPECYQTMDETRGIVHKADPVVRDVCINCNNQLSYIDAFAKSFIQRYFLCRYKSDVSINIEYDYSMLQKMLLKYAYNDMRSHSYDISYFDEDLLHFLVDSSNVISKKHITILGGIAVNTSPVSDHFFGNRKIQWRMNPFFCNSTVMNFDPETGRATSNESLENQEFRDLAFSYSFRFNSGQFIILCWDKNISDKTLSENNVILKFLYPYTIFSSEDDKAVLKKCTFAFNFHSIDTILVSFDLSDIDFSKSYYRQETDLIYEKIEENLKKLYPR